MSLGPSVWHDVEGIVTELERDGPSDHAMHRLESTRLALPVEIADYCDFYASEHHASNMGRILRPGSDPLPRAWRHIPIGYHGRSGTVVVSGTPVRRPYGVIFAADREPAHDGGSTDGPVYTATRRLDLEVELGFLIGPASTPGRPVSVRDALSHVFGAVVLNDWSARDIQSFEYQPLGPFLGKSFATSISAWVVPMSVLEHFRVDGPDQGAGVEPHLVCDQPRGLDVTFELAINSTVLSRPAARHLHWSVEQLVAHLTSNGSHLRTGDLLATGTISGPDDTSWGSLMELTWGGSKPVCLDDGSRRFWLEDGDTVTIRAWCGDEKARNGTAGGSAGDKTAGGSAGDKTAWVELGEVTGTIVDATADSIAGPGWTGEAEPAK